MKRTLAQSQYIQIYEAVREEILSGTRRAGVRLPSIRSFAKQWAVSTITVIKAFDKLKDEGLVISTERSGFFVASGKKSAVIRKKIGFLVPVKAQELYENKNIQAACRYLKAYADKSQHRLSMHLARWGAEGGGHVYLSAQAISDYGLDAVVLMDVYNYHYLSSLATLRIPIIMLDADASNLGIDSLYFDNVHAAVQLTQTLINLGHRHILFVGGPLPSALGVRKKMYADPATLQRLDGCRLVMDQRPEQRFLHTAFSRSDRSAEAWSRAGNAYLNEHPEITAIVAESPLDLEPAHRAIKQAVFCGAQLKQQPAIVGQAICHFDALGALLPEMLQQRLSEPLAPLLRRSVQTQVVYD